MRRLFTFLFLTLPLVGYSQTAPATLVNTAHGAEPTFADFIILHPELNTPAGLRAFDVTCIGVSNGTDCSTNANFDANIIADSQNTSASNANAANWTYPVNNAPYILVNNSFSGYTLQTWGDLGTYTPLQTHGVMMSWAFIQPLSPGTPPPITSTTVMATSGAASIAGANWGLELGMTDGYKGLNTSAPSWVCAAMTAVLAAMKTDHPDWNWADIKGALRQTAANWSTGWDPTQFGYGAVDYDAATAIPGTAAIYLQPPILQASPAGNQITVTLYPFRSSRRAYEVVYWVPATYNFPMKNEFTAGDIANLVSAGGQLAFTGNTTDVLVSGVASAAPTWKPGNRYRLVAFTTDNAGGYSRVESWGPRTVIAEAAPAPNLAAIERAIRALLLSN